MSQLPKAVKNRSLFSNYYLDSLIVEQPQWVGTPDIESDYAAIKNLFDAVVPDAEHLKEAQTERQFIQPLLEQLGHIFEVQPTLQTSQGTREPDYAFFASESVLNTAQSHINTNQFFKTALAVGDAKAWSRNLDRKVQGSGDPFTNQNPNYQIDCYLRGADKDWGILTNGRQWRLYHRQTSYRLDSFYEVDLAALLSENGDLETFRYFYCLFRRDAFIPDASGTSFLDRVLMESQQYTVGVSDDLKNRVYDALRLLIDGFLKYPHNRFGTANPPLDQIHTNSLILLYRVLFILYAESRDLLPLDNRDYALQYSLDYLATDLHEKLDGGITPAPGVSLYWTRLKELFRLINDGWDDHIPQYNGGLFNPKQHPFLERYEIGDDALAQVIELLTRTEADERIAYRDLDVRHLGDIYEGLLEYQPQIADQDLVIVSKKGSETVAPKSSPNQEVAYPEGAVYLLTDKGDRKATGSYYTPDYIVRYIVENTLAPLCESKTVDEILSLKILDPATGSGHFLVGVVDYLAEELITHPDAPHITERTDAETELAYWRRRVVESCVYGVDLNPMAVELAKLSLWLHTVAKGEPLSFLDHHIRCGNSLIGAKIENLSNLPELKKNRRRPNQSQTEISMAFPFTDTVATAIGHYLLIEETESRTADQIHAKEHQLDIAQKMLRSHKGVANLWTSVYFGNDVSRATYHQALNALRSQDTDALENLLSYRRAREIGKEKRFFHWEIEFPEVFRDKYGREKGNPGFDAVVGNPPYIRQEALGDIKPFLARYQTYSGIADLYVYFVEQAHELMREGGRFGMITSNKFMRANYGKNLRAYLSTNTALNEIVDFGELPVFEDAAAMTAILLTLRESVHAQAFRFTQIQTLDFDSLQAEVDRIGEQLDQDALGENWTLAPAHEIRLLNKIRENSTTLIHYCEGEIRRGITTGFNEAFIIDAETRDYLIDEDPRSAEIIKPCVVGDDIRKYEIQFRERYLIFTRRGVDVEQYPAIKQYLNQYRAELEPKKSRAEKHGRKVGNYRWYEIQDTTAYYAEFEKPKIVYPDIGMSCRFCFDESGLLLTNNAYLIPTSDLYLLAILNSRMTFYYLKHICAVLGEVDKRGRLRFIYQYMQDLPIRCINFTTPADERDCQLKKAKTLYQFCLDKGSIDCVLGFVRHHLTADPERAEVVHDLLAFLAEEMVEMNREKGEEIRGFLRWLEREIGGEIDTLKNKTAIQGYFNLTLEKLLEILKKNRRSIAVDPSDRNFQESLEREFTRSLTKFNPLLTRIQQTDALIDQVVYQLYGLTDKEIAVVVQ